MLSGSNKPQLTKKDPSKEQVSHNYDSSQDNSILKLIPETPYKTTNDGARGIHTENPLLILDQTPPKQYNSINANVQKNVDLMGISSFNRVEPATSENDVSNGQKTAFHHHRKLNSVSSSQRETLINKYESISIGSNGTPLQDKSYEPQTFSPQQYERSKTERVKFDESPEISKQLAANPNIFNYQKLIQTKVVKDQRIKVPEKFIPDGTLVGKLLELEEDGQCFENQSELYYELGASAYWMNKSGTKIVTVKELFGEDPNASPSGKSSRRNLKSISYDFKVCDILDDNYCCKVKQISRYIQEIPNQFVDPDRYNNEKFNCYSLAFSENEEHMVYFDGVNCQLLIFKINGGLTEDFQVEQKLMLCLELLSTNDITHDIKFAKILIDQKDRIQLNYACQNKYFHYRSMKPSLELYSGIKDKKKIQEENATYGLMELFMEINVQVANYQTFDTFQYCIENTFFLQMRQENVVSIGFRYSNDTIRKEYINNDKVNIMGYKFLGYFYIEGYLHICLLSNQMKITVIDELSSVKLGKIVINQEIIIPIDLQAQFQNHFLVHYNEGVYYFVKYVDEETLKNQGKIHSTYKLNDSFMYINEVVGYHFGHDDAGNVKVEEHYRFTLPKTPCFHSKVDLQQSLSRLLVLSNKYLIPLQPKERDFIKLTKTIVSQDFLQKINQYEGQKTANLYSDEIFTQISKKNPKFSGCELEEYFVDNGLHKHYSMRDLIEIVQKKIETHLDKGLCEINYKDPRNTESLRRKVQVFGKNQSVPSFGPYKPSFDYVRLSYIEYLEIISDWYYRSATQHNFNYIDRCVTSNPTEVYLSSFLSTLSQDQFKLTLNQSLQFDYIPSIDLLIIYGYDNESLSYFTILLRVQSKQKIALTNKRYLGRRVALESGSSLCHRIFIEDYEQPGSSNTSSSKSSSSRDDVKQEQSNDQSITPLSARLKNDTSNILAKMPTINRFCIHESDPENMQLETVTINRCFSDLTLGRERNFLISNTGDQILMAFQNNSLFEESDNLVTFFNVEFERDLIDVPPFLINKEDLYSEAGLTRIFSYNYFQETTFSMIREEDKKFHQDLIMARLKLEQHLHHYQILMHTNHPVIIYKSWYVLANKQYLFFISRETMRVKSSIKFQFLIVDIHVDLTCKDDLYLITQPLEPSAGIYNQIYKVNIMRDIPFYIPNNLFLKYNLYTRLHHKNMCLQYYESFYYSQEHQTLAELKLRYEMHHLFDQNYNDESTETFKKMMDHIQTGRIKDILDYNLIDRSNIISKIVKIKTKQTKNVLLRAIEKKIQESTLKELPYLTPDNSLIQTKSGENANALSILLKEKNHKLILQLIGTMLQHDRFTGYLYEQIIPQQLDELMKQGFDLNEYFKSQLFFHKINTDENFSELQPNEEIIIMPSYQKSLYAIKIHNQDIIDRIYKHNNKISKGPAKIGEFQSQSQSAADPLIQVKKQSLYDKLLCRKPPPEPVKDLYENEFYVVNLKVLNELSQKMMEHDINHRKITYLDLIEKLGQRDMTVYEIESIQTILEYKWRTYAQKFFIPQLVLVVIFTICFFVDLNLMRDQNFKEEPIIPRIAMWVICLLITAFFMFYEVLQFKWGSMRIKNYFDSFWNLNDIMLIITYCVYLALAITKKFVDNSDVDSATSTLQFCVVILVFIKICSLLRIFESYCFLVKMLLGVFYDLKHFLFFFLFVITAFTMMSEIVLFSSHSSQSEAEGDDDYIYEKYLKKDKGSSRSDFLFFVLSMRESIGDYDTDTLTNRDATKFPLLSWTLWFIVMLVGNIVFMNFIIAVVSESYEKCMQSMSAESYRSKLDMIVECEQFLPDSWRFDKKWFPDYIVLCRPIDSQQTINGMKDEQWLGFINAINKNSNSNFQRVMAEMRRETSRNETAQALLHQVNMNNEAMAKQIKDIEVSMRIMKADQAQKFNTIDAIAGMMRNFDEKLTQSLKK